MLELSFNKRLIISIDFFTQRQITSIIHASNVLFRNDINRQVQQLHQEEMEMLRVEHTEEVTGMREEINRMREEMSGMREEINGKREEITKMREEIKRLQGEVIKMKQQLIAMQKNSKHHVCELNSDNNQSFLIQNIDIIKCTNNDSNDNNQYKQQLSKLDESQLYQFNEIIINKKVENNSNKVFIVDEMKDNLNINNDNIDDCILVIPKSQQQMLSQQQQQQQQSLIYQHHKQSQKQQHNKQLQKYQQHHKQNNKSNNNKINNNNQFYQQKINQLNIRIIQLQSQIQSLFETNKQLKKQKTKLQLSQKSIKNNYDSLYKQSKFMADHIRTLANDKFKLQRKLKQLQKQIRDLNVNKQLKKSNTLLYDSSYKQNNSSISIVNSSSVNSSSVRLSKNDDKINKKNNFNNNNKVNLYASQGFDFVKTSQQNSIDYKDIQPNNTNSDKQLQHVSIPKVISIENFNQQHKNQDIPTTTNPMTQSQFLQVNKQFQTRKSMPSYKKVSHISPSPSFKKPILNNNKDKSPQFLKLVSSSSQHLKQDIFDKSDFMDQIRKQIQIKVTQKKTTIIENHQAHRPSSLFQDLTKKRSNTKN